MLEVNNETGNVQQANDLTGQVNNQAQRVQNIVGEAVNQPTAKQQKLQKQLEDLSAMRISAQTEVVPEAYSLSVDGVGVFALGDIHGLKGKQKSGKSAVLKVCAAALLSGKQFRIRSELKEPVVLFIDTEQQRADVKLVIDEVKWMTHVEDAYIDSHLFLYALRRRSYDTLLADTRLLIERHQAQVVFIDGLVDYSEETKNEIFNTRIRFDIIDCFPEMLSNNLRNYDETHTTTSSEDPASPARNYILPNGYLDGVKVNTDGFFLYQGARNTYWSYEGDEFNCCSDVNSYDVEFYLPSVPTGTYQIRLGFADMPTRGICQFYLDGEPKGVPFDERDTNFEMRTGYVPLSTLDGSSYTSEEREAAKKNMHNLGWYHGPKGVFNATAGHKDGRDALGNVAQIFSDNPRTVRYVLSTETLEEHVRHKIRIKSIWAVGTALIMLDYLELVPKSVYGVEGEGRAEDDY